jgi:hypothetical protein
MSTEKSTPNAMGLYSKLIQIRKTCTYLKKDNQGYQFKYVSSSQTLGTLRSKMDELGVLLVPAIKWHQVTEHANSKGNKEFFTELEVEFTWMDAETGESLTCPFYAQGIDSGEKGVGKAMTYAEKYFMLKFFNIATDKDDPDAFQNKYNEKNGHTQAQGQQTDQPQGSQPQTPGQGAQQAPPQTQNGTQPPKATEAQVKKIHVLCGKLGYTNHDKKIENVNIWLNQKGKPPVPSTKELDKKDASELIELLERHVNQLQRNTAKQQQAAQHVENATALMDEAPF